METEDFDIELAYNELKSKYSLPEFEKLIEDFDIEKLADKETIFLAREIRRTISEKIAAYLQLIETFINPHSSPMFVFSILKNLSQQNKDSIKKIYATLSKIQIEVLKLDTIYNEDSEAKFIDNTFKTWQETKPTIYKIIEDFQESLEENNTSKRESYLD
jgi:hypothetical protein